MYEDFPDERRNGVTVSDTVDFTVDRLFDNDIISEYIPEMFKK